MSENQNNVSMFAEAVAIILLSLSSKAFAFTDIYIKPFICFDYTNIDPSLFDTCLDPSKPSPAPWDQNIGFVHPADLESGSLSFSASRDIIIEPVAPLTWPWIGDVTLSAGHDVIFNGVSVIIQGTTQINAGGDISLSKAGSKITLSGGANLSLTANDEVKGSISSFTSPKKKYIELDAPILDVSVNKNDESLTVTAPTIKDTIEDSIAVQIVDELVNDPSTGQAVKTGEGLQALFTPNFFLPLNTAEKIVDVDHFNWVSLVLNSDYLDVCTTSTTPDCDRIRLQDGSLPVAPFADPPPGGFAYQQPLGDDSAPFYLNETDPRTWNYIDKWTSPLGVVFTDYPKTPGTTKFLTILAGVYEDLTGVFLDSFADGVAIRWSVIGNDIKEVSLAAPYGSGSGSTEIDSLELLSFDDLSEYELSAIFSTGIPLLSGRALEDFTSAIDDEPDQTQVPIVPTALLVGIGLVALRIPGRNEHAK